MPDQHDTELDRNTPALALSGGGFRATLYHCGAFIRLNELGYLCKFSRISSVSGGSIASGLLAARWSRLKRHGDVFTNLDAEVIQPLREFCRRSIDKQAVGWGAILPGKSIGDVVADFYDEYLFSGISLQDLPADPQFIFNATNLQTGRLVRLSKAWLREYTIGQIAFPDIRLAVAVAASSAFPPVLSPVELKLDSERWEDVDGAQHFGNPDFTKALSLTDGGAYDNLGLETVDDFNPVVVSDAGAPFGTEAASSTLWPKQTMRALDIATDQARAVRKRLLFATCASQGRTVAFSGIDCDASSYRAPPAIAIDPDRVAWLAQLRTRLNPFNDEEQGCLINWGWLMMDTAMRSHVTTGVPAPTQLPLPQHPLA